MKKKDKSKKSSKKSSGDDDLKKMRDQHNRLKEKAEGGGGGGGGEKKFDELKVGRNNRRILPRILGDKIIPQFYTESFVHFKVGPNQWTVRCIGDKFIDKKNGRPTPGTPCPVCKKFLKEQDKINSEHEKGDPDGKRLWKEAKDKYCPRVRYYFNVITPDGDVKLHSCGDQIMEQLLGYFFEDDSDVGDFTAIDDGCWLNFKRIGDGRSTKYKIFPGDRAPIEDQWEEIKELLQDLEAARGEVRSPESINNVMKGIKDEADDSDNASDDGSDEDEDEDGDDEDEDEEDEEEEDEDEDDEDEKPIKKSKLSEKMKLKLKKKSKK